MDDNAPMDVKFGKKNYLYYGGAGTSRGVGERVWCHFVCQSWFWMFKFVTKIATTYYCTYLILIFYFSVWFLYIDITCRWRVNGKAI